MSELIQQLGNLLEKEIFTPDYPVKISQIARIICDFGSFGRNRKLFASAIS